MVRDGVERGVKNLGGEEEEDVLNEEKCYNQFIECRVPTDRERDIILFLHHDI